jgi:hypothetical protein
MHHCSTGTLIMPPRHVAVITELAGCSGKRLFSLFGGIASFGFVDLAKGAVVLRFVEPAAGRGR